MSDPAIREFHDEIGSTQARALELARNGAPDGTRVVAARQSAGRGRVDHRWDSPAGGLYLSIILRTPGGPSSLLPLAIGAELAEAFDRTWSIRVRLKWPNDLLVEEPAGPPRKLAGVLVDVVGPPPRPAASVVGIGINVLRPSGTGPVDFALPAVGLERLVDPVPSLPEVEEVAADAVRSAARALQSAAGREAVLTRCRALLYGVGRRAWIDGVLVGRLRSVDDDGALRVEGEDGPMTIRAGDLRVDDR